MKRHLLIIADDFGYGKARNLGIVECFKKNSISAVSILANCKFTGHAIDLAQKHKIPVGLHFNITEGYPLSDPQLVSSLVRSDGKFLGKTGFWTCSKIAPLHVELELNAQILWFEHVFGRKPLHVDGHQHVQVHVDVANVFAKLLHKHGIKRTRIPEEHSVSPSNARLSATRRTFHFKINSLAAKSFSTFNAFQLVKTEGFLGMNLMGKAMSIEILQEALKNFFVSGFTTCELMTHPGYKCDRYADGFAGEDFADAFSCSPEREHELRVLTSPDMLQFYKDKNIDLSIEWF